MANSAPGSTKGKYDGCSRVRVPGAQERGRHLGDGAAQVGHRHPRADHERLELVELRLVGGVHGLVAKDAAGHDHLDRRRVGAHVAHLHRARVGPQQAPVRGPEGVLGVARGVLGREVERLEVVVVVLELGADGDVVAEAAEDVEQSVGHLREQVVAAGRHPLPRKGEVDALRGEAGVERGALQRRFAGLDRPLDRLLALVQRATDGATHVGRQRGESLELLGDRALLAEQPHPQVLQGAGVRGGVDGG